MLITLNKRPRDSQRSRVYAWERLFYPTRDCRRMLSRNEMAELVTQACGLFGTPLPRLPRTRARRVAFYRPGKHELHIPAWAQYPEIVLHEVAHATLYNRRDVEAHGPEFVARFMVLLVRLAGYDRDNLFELARSARVRT
jgi:hypothetical protein